MSEITKAWLEIGLLKFVAAIALVVALGICASAGKMIDELRQRRANRKGRGR